MLRGIQENGVVARFGIYPVERAFGFIPDRAKNPGVRPGEASQVFIQVLCRAPPRDVSEALKRIKQLAGLKRSLTQVRKFIKHVLKFRYRKFRPLPGGS